MATILLVDDSAVDRRLFGQLLAKQGGFHVEYAEHGAAALQLMHNNVPDLVLTDMRMPELDGLQLVNAIQNLYPTVPVILMTGHGSEALATKALRRGAASYVPKSLGKDVLIETVRHVLELSRAEGNYGKLVGCYNDIELNITLTNDPSLIDALVGHAQQLAMGMGICGMSGRLQLGIAMKEALLNAMYHGNLELTAEEISSAAESPNEPQGTISAMQRKMAEAPFRDRKIFVSVRIDAEEAQLTIRDEGPGFDVKELAEVKLTASPQDMSGRGLFLMWAFMDRVKFNRTGNEVTLIKRRATTQRTRDEQAAKQLSDEETTSDTSYEDNFGQLVPTRGGDPIPLPKSRLIVGNNESCDIVIGSAGSLYFHCVLYLYRGWWYVKDLDRRGGIRVNRAVVTQRRLSPGAALEISDASYVIEYDPLKLGADPANPPPDL